MTRKVLLDANLLIAVFDPQTKTSLDQQHAARVKLIELLEDQNTALVITPLIRYEVLRGIQWQEADDYRQVRNALGQFTELDIDQATAELAADLFRYDRACSPDRNLDKRKFDAFHLATAKCHHLEISSQDSDIIALEKLYSDFVESSTA